MFHVCQQQERRYHSSSAGRPSQQAPYRTAGWLGISEFDNFASCGRHSIRNRSLPRTWHKLLLITAVSTKAACSRAFQHPINSSALERPTERRVGPSVGSPTPTPHISQHLDFDRRYSTDIPDPGSCPTAIHTRSPSATATGMRV